MLHLASSAVGSSDSKKFWCLGIQIVPHIHDGWSYTNRNLSQYQTPQSWLRRSPASFCLALLLRYRQLSVLCLQLCCCAKLHAQQRSCQALQFPLVSAIFCVYATAITDCRFHPPQPHPLAFQPRLGLGTVGRWRNSKELGNGSKLLPLAEASN